MSVDPTLSSERLLYRLFHERGVKVFAPQAIRAACRCSDERIAAMLRNFTQQERDDMVGDNGKIGELNDTDWTSMNGGVHIQLPDGSNLQASAFGDIERSHFNFLAVSNSATTRNVVRLATDQHVPTNAAGGMAQWSKAMGASNVFSLGVDDRFGRP